MQNVDVAGILAEKVKYIKLTRQEMGDELMGSPEQVSSQPVSAVKRAVQRKKAVGALCNKSGSGRTAAQCYQAEIR